jgi:ubiquinone/menaquinone biosynthesis C-methylase UbiE
MSSNEVFGKYTEAYDAVMSNLPGYQELLGIYKKALSGRKRILDSGCHTGIFDIEMLRYDPETHLYCIDRCKPALEILERNADGYGDRLHVYHGDVNSLPFSDNFFDGILSSLVIGFVDEPRLYIGEKRRVAASGARLIISGPDNRARYLSDRVIAKWREDLRKAGTYAELKEAWRIMKRHTKENTDNVRNWFEINRLSRMLVDGFGLKIIDQMPNPLYYGMGYVIISEKP